jgi:hypothetical protein
VVAVIGLATVVAACVLLYTFRDHDGRGPNSNTPIPVTDKGKTVSPAANPEVKADTAELAGFVADATSGELLKEVELSLPDYDDVHGTTPNCRTDPQGRFHFRDLPASSQPVRLVAHKEGYGPYDNYISLGVTNLPVTLNRLPRPGG